MIARDREATIGRALDSVAPFVDELLVVDTGSTDRTVEIAREHGARVEYFEWCDDFAAARNAALDFGTTDWAFALDSDEWIEPVEGQRLHNLAAQGARNNVHVYKVFQHSIRADGTTIRIANDEQRMLPRRPDLRWEGACSEMVRYRPNPPATHYVLADPPFTIWHTGYDLGLGRLIDKHERNRRCIDKALQRNPLDGLHLGIAARFCADMGRGAESECIRLCKRFVGAEDPRCTDLLQEVLGMWFVAAVSLRDQREISEAYGRMRDAGPVSATTHCLLAGHELMSIGRGCAGTSDEDCRARLAHARRRIRTAISHLESAVERTRYREHKDEASLAYWSVRDKLDTVRQLLADLEHAELCPTPCDSAFCANNCASARTPGLLNLSNTYTQNMTDTLHRSLAGAPIWD